MFGTDNQLGARKLLDSGMSLALAAIISEIDVRLKRVVMTGEVRFGAIAHEPLEHLNALLHVAGDAGRTLEEPLHGERHLVARYTEPVRLVRNAMGGVPEVPLAIGGALGHVRAYRERDLVPCVG